MKRLKYILLIMPYIILSLGFSLLFLSVNVSVVNAITTSITTDYLNTQSDITNKYPLPCDTLSLCSSISTTICWNSQSVGVTDCGTACGGGNVWTKYNYTQQTSIDCRQVNSQECVAVFHSDGALTCSTGDKYNDAANGGTGDLSQLRAGFCSCSPGGQYKTCCSNGLTSLANHYQIDPYNPDEADCGGATVTYCGGAGQPACGQAACATATPAPTPTPTPGVCTPGATQVLCDSNTKTCNK